MLKMIFVKIPRAVADAAESLWASHNNFGRIFLVLAVGSMVVDACISYQYGVSQTLMHGLGFALLAFVFAVMPDAAYREFDEGRYGSGLALSLACIPFALVAYQSHVGYSAGVRVGDIQNAAYQTEVKDGTREDVEQAKADVKSAEAVLARLQWLPDDVTHDGIRAEIATKLEAIRQEEKRGGCGPNCLRLKKELAELEKRKGALEDRSKEQARKDAALAFLAKARAKAEATKPANSITVHQNEVAAQIVNLVRGQSPEQAIKPDRVTLVFMNAAISGANSFAFMLMAMTCWFVAGRNRIKIAVESGMASIANKASAMFPASTTHIIPVAKSDNRLDGLIEALRAKAA